MARTPLTQEGLDEALDAAELPDAALLWTVVAVETGSVTRGYGFRSDRCPHLLFERHKFREFTGGRFDAAAPDLSGSRGAPYGSFAAQRQRFEQALEMSEQAGLGPEPALKAASWGLGQVMGFNHHSAGYTSAQAMVADMIGGEDRQLIAMARFLRSTGLAMLLRECKWEDFARGYNGPAFSENRYDEKLKVEFENAIVREPPDLRVRTAQSALLLLRFSPGVIDGLFGRQTLAALNRFKASRGELAVTVLDDQTYSDLLVAAGFN